MRIAVVASLVTPLLRAQAGGAQAFVGDLARGLGLRHSVDVYCAAGSDIEGVNLVPIPVAAGVARALFRADGSLRVVPELREGFERLFLELGRRGADAVSSHAFDAEAIELAEGLPVLHTLHLPPLAAPVVAAARRTRAAMVTVSASAQATWAAAGVRAAVIQNGVPDFRPPAVQPAPVALVPGRISPEKGTAAAVRVARSAGLRPLVVGDPYDPGYFRAQVEPLLRPGEYRPAVARQELWRLMAGAAAVLMPIDWEEPFGLVAAEAQVAGCPVAAYRRGALPEVVEESVGGLLVEPGDEAALAEAARRLSGFDREAVRASGRRRLLIDRTIADYEAALARLA